MAPQDVTDADGAVLRRDVRLDDGSLVESFIANGDGTWEHMTFNPDGTLIYSVEVDALPVPVVSDLSEQITAARASVLAATTVAQVKARTVALFDLLNT